ncbi:MAG: hypothetical protein ACI9PP_000307 [Halobacteriales archaeon]|jgi:hypothetical protein
MTNARLGDDGRNRDQAREGKTGGEETAAVDVASDFSPSIP